jgi:hypothetical protein
VSRFRRKGQSVGQGIDPALEAVALGADQAMVAQRAGEHGDPLVGGDQGDGQVPGVGPADGAELEFGLADKPGQDSGGLSAQHGEQPSLLLR